MRPWAAAISARFSPNETGLGGYIIRPYRVLCIIDPGVGVDALIDPCRASGQKADGRMWASAPTNKPAGGASLPLVPKGRWHGEAVPEGIRTCDNPSVSLREPAPLHRGAYLTF